jgi:hypothetical protein
VDKQVYGAVLKNRHPGLVLVPSGGKGVITSFAALNRAVLEKTLWGVEFFMLCDRDAVPLSRPVDEVERAAGGRLRVLGRYHIENYFLDSTLISNVFQQMEPEDSWLRSPAEIENRLRDIARSTISYAVALSAAAELRDRVGNLDVMPDAVHEKTVDELVPLLLARIRSERSRISNAIEERDVEARIRASFADFEAAVSPGSERWKIILPGKPILGRFAGLTRLDLSRLKTMYIRAAEASAVPPFREIDDIFSSFAKFGRES